MNPDVEAYMLAKGYDTMDLPATPPERKPMTNTVLSLIRTYVPVGVGALAAWLVTLGVELSDEARNGLVVFLTGLAIAVYYTVARLLEKRWPKFGVLLGSTKQPEYSTPPVSEVPVDAPVSRSLTEPVRNYPQY